MALFLVCQFLKISLETNISHKAALCYEVKICYSFIHLSSKVENHYWIGISRKYQYHEPRKASTLSNGFISTIRGIWPALDWQKLSWSATVGHRSETKSHKIEGFFEFMFNISLKGTPNAKSKRNRFFHISY